MSDSTRTALEGVSYPSVRAGVPAWSMAPNSEPMWRCVCTAWQDLRTYRVDGKGQVWPALVCPHCGWSARVVFNGWQFGNRNSNG